MYAVPSELLVAQPVSDTTQRLLGGFSQAARGLKAEAVSGTRHTADSAAAAVAAFFAPGDGNGDAEGLSMDDLPSLVLVAMAHALDYLQQFNLQAVLRQRCAFRHFREANEISLSPNALRPVPYLNLLIALMGIMHARSHDMATCSLRLLGADLHTGSMETNHSQEPSCLSHQ